MPGGNLPASPGGRTGVRVVVVGDRSTGKSSLIAAAAAESFPDTVSPVLPPTRLPVDFFPDRVPVTIIDTFASLESRGKLIEELKKADVVVLTYACDQPLTLTRLSGFWLEELRRLEVNVPVIVAGCKLDLRDENEPVSLEQVMGPIMQRYREIETCIECSAVTLMQVPDVFYYAQKAVLHPTAPLFDQESQTLRPRCVRALKRIFLLCDRDMDGALNDSELNDFQVNCFNAPLQPAEIVGVKRVVQEKKREGVNDVGLTLDGFLFLHSLFIDRGRLETTWSVLRKFGYDDQLKLRNDFLPIPLMQGPDQVTSRKFIEKLLWHWFLPPALYSIDFVNNKHLRGRQVGKQSIPDSEAVEVTEFWIIRPTIGYITSVHAFQNIELTTEAVEFLRGTFCLFATDNHGALRPAELDELFSTAPESPWVDSPYKGAAETSPLGNLTLNGFLSLWALMTFLNPRNSLANLIYIGYTGTPASALRVTRRRSVERKKQQTERSVFHCLVVGPRNAGKSALLDSFLDRPFVENHNTTAGGRYAVNIIDQLGGNKKTLILHEVPEDEVRKLLSNRQSLATCDIAIFLYDCSDEYSWKRASDMLFEVARQGEETGFGVPCLFVAAKDDLEPYPNAVQDSVKVCQELGIEAPVPVSTRLGETNNLFFRILRAAETPHLGIPETETGRRRKQLRQLVNHSLMFMSVGAALAVVGLAAFRAYSAKKNSSS